MFNHIYSISGSTLSGLLFYLFYFPWVITHGYSNLTLSGFSQKKSPKDFNLNNLGETGGK